MTTRRERKKRETRNNIATTAMKLFLERGFEATTVDMIAEHADVARGTVFLHFPSKEAILAQWGHDRFEAIEEHRAEWDQPDSTTAEKVMHVFRMALAGNEANFPLVKVWVKSTLASGLIHERQQAVSLRSLMADILEEGQEKGEVKEHIDPIMAGNMLENIYLHALYDWVLAEGTWPIEEILATKIGYLFGGLSA